MCWQLEDACKKYNVELLLWDSGATVGGMSEDVQKLKEEISSMIKTAERQQQESMIANLVQWYYFDVSINESVLFQTSLNSTRFM